MFIQIFDIVHSRSLLLLQQNFHFKQEVIFAAFSIHFAGINFHARDPTVDFTGNDSLCLTLACVHATLGISPVP